VRGCTLLCYVMWEYNNITINCNGAGVEILVNPPTHRESHFVTLAGESASPLCELL